MKPLKYNQKYITCDKWVRINYKNMNESTHGYYIMKKDVYLDNRKKFEKLFKNTLIEIIMDYPVNMYDITESAVRSLEYEFSTYEYQLNREEKRIYPDEERIDYLTTKLTKLHSKMFRLKRKLIYE